MHICKFKQERGDYKTMTEITGERRVFYLRNDRGTVIREADPNEAARLQREANYSPISAAEGMAAFANKQRVFENLDIVFGGQLSEATGVKSGK